MGKRGRGNLTFHGPFLGSSAHLEGVSETFRVGLGKDPRHLFFAGIAQLVEHHLAKVGVAGSSPVSRSERGVSPSLTTCNPSFLGAVAKR